MPIKSCLFQAVIGAVLLLSMMLTVVVPDAAMAQSRGGGNQSGGISRRGGSDGGGGNICYFRGAPVLLEFAGRSESRSSPGIRFPEDDEKLKQSNFLTTFMNHYELAGFSDMQMLSGRLKVRVQEILEINRPHSPLLVAMLERGIIEFSASRFSTTSALKADYSNVPRECNASTVRASVVFLNTMHAMVDVARWNSLDLESQAGLWFHENFRVLQHVTRGPEANSREFTDRVLQDMVLSFFYAPRSWDDSSLIRNFLLNLPFRVPTDDAVSLTWPVRYTRGHETRNISCRIAARTIEATGEIANFFNRMDRMCEMYTQAHNRRDILALLNPLEREARGVWQRTRSSNMRELLEEIARIRLTLVPEVRISLAIEQIMTPHRGAFMTHYFPGSILMNLDLTDAVQSYTRLSLRTAGSLTELQQNRYDEYRRRTCHPVENVKQLMSTGSLVPTEAVNYHVYQPHPRCAPIQRDWDRLRPGEHRFPGWGF